MEAHKWIHVTAMWGYNGEVFRFGYGPLDNYPPGFLNPASSSTLQWDANHFCRLYVNGRILTEPYQTWVYSMYVGYSFDPGRLRLGGSPWWWANDGMDATLDEMYVWDKHMMQKGNPQEAVTQFLWGKGRYYKEGGAEFTSGSIDLSKLPATTCTASKALPGKAGDKYPDGGDRPSGVDLSYLGDISPLILGINWTGWTDAIYDYFYANTPGEEPEALNAECNLFISLDNGATWLNSSPMKKYWWQWVYQIMGAGNLLRYKVRFDINKADNTILLESPIFDDISIYYKGGKIEFLTWVLV
jgi:hypothetical protein